LKKGGQHPIWDWKILFTSMNHYCLFRTQYDLSLDIWVQWHGEMLIFSATIYMMFLCPGTKALMISLSMTHPGTFHLLRSRSGISFVPSEISVIARNVSGTDMDWSHREMRIAQCRLESTHFASPWLIHELASLRSFDSSHTESFASARSQISATLQNEHVVHLPIFRGG
jgi:hypothetical protein